MKDYTVQDLIEYFRNILNNGGVSGTDFELNEEEKEIYKRTIICLIALLSR